MLEDHFNFLKSGQNIKHQHQPTKTDQMIDKKSFN